MTPDKNAITSFTGDYRFLSNFHPSVIYYDGIDFPTVEHAYQAAKTESRMHRIMIRDAVSPGKAKRMGQKVPLIRGFHTDGTALKVMEALVTQKFVRHKPLRELLLRTGSLQLVEGNDWGDQTWGMVQYGKEWRGDNHLGIILMLVRERIRNGTLRCLE